ncbi:DUF3846 domain-containing protein [Bacillus sporothermodurans]|uniref:DUF3846 domain-containing protein n=1 Tax=Heyndrickxia sporothermodurans TaxID=46224 RepID=UPI00192C009C|nr:DUF3846 domain-containing protein [Heyndrickxia sporothermodurans]MBL5830871.1 DUF3846 domain-containing protein [Heyndrickxia sporothermodurans]MBL5872369.1 DUF3846 domain-containing protein [Heyndrickxia sporothermodurans]
MGKMTFMVVKAGLPPVIEQFEVKSEQDTYNIIKNAVGGYVEALRLSDTCTLWVNEEGKINDLKPNFQLLDRAGIPQDYVVGNVIFTGVDDNGSTVGLTEEDLKLIEKRFISRTAFQYNA